MGDTLRSKNAMRQRHAEMVRNRAAEIGARMGADVAMHFITGLAIYLAGEASEERFREACLYAEGKAREGTVN